MKKFIVAGVTVAVLAGIQAPCNAALSFYVRIKGQKQGEFRSDVAQRGREGQIEGIEYKHDIVSPRDAASGQATGKRQHKPITISMAITDRTYPMLIQALTQNESLPMVEMRFWAPNRLGTAGGTGVEVNYMTITLTNASISRISTRLPNTKDPNLMRFSEYAEVELTYQKINVTNHSSKTMAEDDWETPIAEAPRRIRVQPAGKQPIRDMSRSARRVSRR